MHISKRTFQNIIKIANDETISKLVVLTTLLPLTCKPLKHIEKTCINGIDNRGETN